MTQKESEDFLNTEIIDELNYKFSMVLDEVSEENPDSDLGLEAVSVLLSIAAQIAIDMGMEKQGFSRMTSQFFQEISEISSEDQINPKLFGQHKEVVKEKPN